jgi:hypothetical protein
MQAVNKITTLPLIVNQTDDRTLRITQGLGGNMKTD